MLLSTLMKNLNLIIAIFVINMKKHVGTNQSITTRTFSIVRNAGWRYYTSRTHLQHRTFRVSLLRVAKVISIVVRIRRFRGRKGRTDL